jgi:hypothetical protein
MDEELNILTLKTIENQIFTIQGVQVMLDSHLAEMYQVETKILNRAVKRNEDRFPESFRFQLTNIECKNLRCQFGTSSEDSLRFQIGTVKKGRGQHRKYIENMVCLLKNGCPDFVNVEPPKDQKQ